MDADLHGVAAVVGVHVAAVHRAVGAQDVARRPGGSLGDRAGLRGSTVTPEDGGGVDVRRAQGVDNLFNLIQLGNLFPFQLFVGTQVPYMNYYFPPGVALRLPAGSGFDFNSRSVNRSGEEQEGEVYVNLHTVDPSKVQRAANYDNFGNDNIKLSLQFDFRGTANVQFVFS